MTLISQEGLKRFISPWQNTKQPTMTTATLYEPPGAVIASYRASLVSRLVTGCLKKRMPSNQDLSTTGFQGPLGGESLSKPSAINWGWGWGTLPANLNFQT